MAAVSQAVAELERGHDQLHPFQCLCRDAFFASEVAPVTDVRRESNR